ncbi:MAG: PorT family protein [Bacteroidales bacterium]|nr:PorT family protein [Bacteroidales bacterium]
MKRFLTTVLAASLMLIGTNAFAQFSVAAGFVNSQTKFDINVLNVIKTSHNANLHGFYAGASYNIPVGTSGLGVAPGVYFAYMTDKDVDIYVASGDLVESYLEIPLDLNMKFPIADGLNGVIYAGPTFAYGVASKINSGSTTIDLYDGTISNYLDYNRIDVLAGGGIGVEFENMVRFDVGYDFGLLNRGGSTVGVHRNQLHAGVAFLF